MNNKLHRIFRHLGLWVFFSSELLPLLWVFSSQFHRLSNTNGVSNEILPLLWAFSSQFHHLNNTNGGSVVRTICSDYFPTSSTVSTTPMGFGCSVQARVFNEANQGEVGIKLGKPKRGGYDFLPTHNTVSRLWTRLWTCFSRSSRSSLRLSSPTT